MALYIVPVPVGNLQDITLRAIEVLKSVNFIITEDTRVSLKLLNHFGIKKKLYSYYKPKEAKQAVFLTEILSKSDGAIITDSGTPLISDPGFILVKNLIRKGVKIFSLPGPTAFIPALTLSGIDPSKFLFLGFAPKSEGKLRTFLKKYKFIDVPLAFYESPRRVRKFLTNAFELLGDRDFALIRELSKMHESIIRGNLSTAMNDIKDETLKGEIVIIIEGSGKIIPENSPEIKSMEDVYTYFKDKYSISKNELKKRIMKKK